MGVPDQRRPQRIPSSKHCPSSGVNPQDQPRPVPDSPKTPTQISPQKPLNLSTPRPRNPSWGGKWSPPWSRVERPRTTPTNSKPQRSHPPHPRRRSPHTHPPRTQTGGPPAPEPAPAAYGIVAAGSWLRPTPAPRDLGHATTHPVVNHQDLPSQRSNRPPLRKPGPAVTRSNGQIIKTQRSGTPNQPPSRNPSEPDNRSPNRQDLRRQWGLPPDRTGRLCQILATPPPHPVVTPPRSIGTARRPPAGPPVERTGSAGANRRDLR